MIHLERQRFPTTVPAKYRDPDRIDNGVELIKGFMTGVNKFYKDGFWKLAKDQLKAESFDKCAFCETPTTASYYGDVEHFRPKQRQMYWWLAYCLDNYVFSCRICNGFKSDQFPANGAAIPGPQIPANPTDVQLRSISEQMTPDPLNQAALVSFDNLCLGEQAVLPNPYQTDPWDFLKWEAIDTLKEVNITHRSAADSQVVDMTIDILKLNRDALRNQRYLTYQLALAFKVIFETAAEPAKTTAEDALTDMMRANMPYCGMIRYFVTVEWQLGIPIP